MELNIQKSNIGTIPFSEQEFQQLFSALYPQVCSIAYRLTGDQDEAEEIASEAFWRLWKNPPPNQENIHGWLYRVATNLAYNRLRAATRRGIYERVEDLFQRILDPERIVEKRQEIDIVRRTLSQLPMRDIQILMLRYSGLSYKEIAGTLGISPGSTGTLLSRAEKKFATLYLKEVANAPER